MWTVFLSASESLESERLVACAAPARPRPPAEPVEIDVCEQGRDHPARGVPVWLRLTAPSVIIPRAQGRRSLRSQILASITRINRPCGISSKHDAMSASTTHRLPCQHSSTRRGGRYAPLAAAEAERARLEVGLEDRLDDHLLGRLHDAVADRRDGGIKLLLLQA